MSHRLESIGELPEFEAPYRPRDEYEPPFVGEVEMSELGLSPEEVGLTFVGCRGDVGCGCAPGVGFSIPNPFKAVKKAAEGTVRSIKRTGVYKTAKKVLHGSVVDTIQKVASNPFVSTFGAPVALPLSFTIATAKGGAKGALEHARMELKNPVRGLVVKAAAVVFPPVAPAAVALEATNRILDAVENGKPEDAVKATAQIAATYALGELGNADALRGMEYLKKAKEMRKNIPRGPLTPAGHPRIEVCGARSEESRGVWLKTHFYMDGPYMKATVYTVTGGDAEVFNLSVDTRPIAAAVAKYHGKLHGDSTKVSGTMFQNLTNVVKKVGKGKLTNEVFSVSKALAGKAKCKAMTPNVPVSDVALAAFAAARKGVDAVDSNAKMQHALKDVSVKLKKYVAVRNVLGKMLPDAKKKAMQNPAVRNAILQGIGAKFAAARFVVNGGPERVKVLKANAMKASAQFAALSRASKSTDPAVREDAQTMSKVVTLAAKARAKTNNVVQNAKGGTPGLVIDPRGRIRKGSFTKRTPGKNDLTQVMLTRGGVQTGMFDKVGKSSVPHYSKALRRRIMTCRADCEAGLGVSGTDPFDIGVSEEPVALIGCIGRATFIGAVRRGMTPPPRRAPARRAAPPPKRPLPVRNRLPAPRNPVLNAVSKLPVQKRVAAAKKIASRLSPAQRTALQKRIAMKKAAMGYQSGSPNPPQYEGGGGGGGGGGDEAQLESYEEYDEEDLDEDLGVDRESPGEDSVVEDSFANPDDTEDDIEVYHDDQDEHDWNYNND